MAAYKVAHDYSAVYRFDPIGFSEGDSVDVDDETAAWVNSDSPGTLIPVDAPQPEPEADAPTEATEASETDEQPEPEADAPTEAKRGRRRGGA